MEQRSYSYADYYNRLSVRSYVLYIQHFRNIWKRSRCCCIHSLHLRQSVPHPCPLL